MSILRLTEKPAGTEVNETARTPWEYSAVKVKKYKLFQRSAHVLLKGQAPWGAENSSVREITKGLVQSTYRMNIFIPILQCFMCVCVCVCVWASSKLLRYYILSIHYVCMCVCVCVCMCVWCQSSLNEAVRMKSDWKDFPSGPVATNLPSNAEDAIRSLVWELRSSMLQGN